MENKQTKLNILLFDILVMKHYFHCESIKSIESNWIGELSIKFRGYGSLHFPVTLTTKCNNFQAPWAKGWKTLVDHQINEKKKKNGELQMAVFLFSTASLNSDCLDLLHYLF